MKKLKPKEKQMYACCCWLTESQYDRLQQYADYKHTTISALVRLLIFKELDTNFKKGD